MDTEDHANNLTIERAIELLIAWLIDFCYVAAQSNYGLAHATGPNYSPAG